MNTVRDNAYIIPVKGLSPGKHEFDFTIGSPFFEEFEDGIIRGASLEAMVVLEKSVSLIAVECKINGSLITECDRCLGELVFPVDISPRLIVKFIRTEEEAENDEVMILEPGETDLDLSQFFYDYICLALPVRHVHKDGECDPEMMKRIGVEKETKKKEKGGAANSPFENLKDLLKNR